MATAMTDEVARLRAEMDQAREVLKEAAGSLWAFYNGLMAQGFKADQALHLTATMLREQLRGAAGSDDES